mmetsp:Transcript_28604/g.62600  ORF Transcript_28604/g.62600 Transcript_28604/m.62600 type:complete len:249 (+) Transcript_28604:754-1500(+)
MHTQDVTYTTVASTRGGRRERGEEEGGGTLTHEGSPQGTRQAPHARRETLRTHTHAYARRTRTRSRTRVHAHTRTCPLPRLHMRPPQRTLTHDLDIALALTITVNITIARDSDVRAFFAVLTSKLLLSELSLQETQRLNPVVDEEDCSSSSVQHKVEVSARLLELAARGGACITTKQPTSRRSLPMSVVEAILIAVEGMTCDNCRGLVESQVSALSGVISVTVSTMAKRAQVAFELTVVTPQEMVARG